MAAARIGWGRFSRTRTGLPVAVFQMRTDLSAEAVTAVLPSLEIASTVTGCVCPGHGGEIAGSRQMRTVPSAPAEARRGSVGWKARDATAPTCPATVPLSAPSAVGQNLIPPVSLPAAASL